MVSQAWTHVPHEIASHLLSFKCIQVIKWILSHHHEYKKDNRYPDKLRAEPNKEYLGGIHYIDITFINTMGQSKYTNRNNSDMYYLKFYRVKNMIRRHQKIRTRNVSRNKVSAGRTGIPNQAIFTISTRRQCLKYLTAVPRWYFAPDQFLLHDAAAANYSHFQRHTVQWQKKSEQLVSHRNMCPKYKRHNCHSDSCRWVTVCIYFPSFIHFLMQQEMLALFNHTGAVPFYPNSLQLNKAPSWVLCDTEWAVDRMNGLHKKIINWLRHC